MPASDAHSTDRTEADQAGDGAAVEGEDGDAGRGVHRGRVEARFARRHLPQVPDLFAAENMSALERKLAAETAAAAAANQPTKPTKPTKKQQQPTPSTPKPRPPPPQTQGPAASASKKQTNRRVDGREDLDDAVIAPARKQVCVLSVPPDHVHVRLMRLPDRHRTPLTLPPKLPAAISTFAPSRLHNPKNK
eukprot:421131-Rhodomonas_salina.4